MVDDDLPLMDIAEAYEQSGGDRKRSMVGAVADEHGHEGEEDDMAKVSNFTCLHIHSCCCGVSFITCVCLGR